MENLTRLVTDSLTRHVLIVLWTRAACNGRAGSVRFPSQSPCRPQQTGIFATPKKLPGMWRGRPRPRLCPLRIPRIARLRVAQPFTLRFSTPHRCGFSRAETPVRRMLAVLQFSEDDDMAFTLDRMFTRINPMRARLSSGQLLPSLRRHRRSGPAPQHLQRPESMDALLRRKSLRHPPAFSSSMEVAPLTEPCGPELSCRRGRLGRVCRHLCRQGPGTRSRNR